MYGNRVFQNPFLLSLEIVKKAYNESLYYISSPSHIEAILEHPEEKRNIFVFAGIPSFKEVCIHLYPNKTLTALKLKLPYESLADFQYQKRDEATLEKQNVEVKKENLEKVTLYLTYKDHTLCYAEQESELVFTEDRKEEIIKSFVTETKNYVYEITENINFLKKKLESFLLSSICKEKLEDEEFLQMIKEIYEEFMAVK